MSLTPEDTRSQSTDRLVRLSKALQNRLSQKNALEDLSSMEAEMMKKRRSQASVEVIITYGCACATGMHGVHVFHDLRKGLESKFQSAVFVLAREEPASFSCFSVHVNNVLVFGCQGRRPTVNQLCAEVRRAMNGERPRLIPYSKATVCDFFGACQKHKYCT